MEVSTGRNHIWIQQNLHFYWQILAVRSSLLRIIHTSCEGNYSPENLKVCNSQFKSAAAPNRILDLTVSHPNFMPPNLWMDLLQKFNNPNWKYLILIKWDETVKQIPLTKCKRLWWHKKHTRWTKHHAKRISRVECKVKSLKIFRSHFIRYHAYHSSWSQF